ncbi:MAG: adenosylcobinamide-GDP ribazoletransferase [Lentisphaeria bacterium]|jgi:adenosylcobinamide-GDP ribazoletransferase
MISGTILDSFLTALRLLTRLPAPGPTSRDNRQVLACFPLVGTLLGLLLALAAALLGHGIFQPAAAFVCALALPLAGWWLTGARGLRSLIWLVSNWGGNGSGNGAVDDYGGVDCTPYWILLALQAVLLCRVALTGLLCFPGDGRVWWLAVPMTLGLAAHAELLARTALAVEERGRLPLHWLVAAGVVLLTSLLVPRAFVAGLLAFVLAWVLTGVGGRLLADRCGAAAGYGFGAIRELVELAALAAGVLAFAGLPST